jgi:hypothetical protein
MAIDMTDEEKKAKKRTAEIKARARKVYDLSFDYHLTHAVFGSDRLLVDDLIEANRETIEKLKDALRAAVREENGALVGDLMAKINELDRTLKKRKYLILVDYVSMDDTSGGRVINVDNKLIITLPKKIIENIVDGAGKLQKEPVEKVRKKMAHELGHIVLHTDLVPKRGLKGTAELDSLDWEAEVFAEELLRLYSEKDHRVD